jgi:hypothetical protein
MDKTTFFQTFKDFAIRKDKRRIKISLRSLVPAQIRKKLKKAGIKKVTVHGLSSQSFGKWRTQCPARDTIKC